MKKLASLLLSSILMLSNSNATVVPSNNELKQISELIITGTIESINKDSIDNEFFTVSIKSTEKGEYSQKTIQIPFNNLMMNIEPMLKSKLENKSVSTIYLIKIENSWQLSNQFVGIQ
jgi:hypothetical protein